MGKWYRVRFRVRVRNRARAREYSSSFLFFFFLMPKFAYIVNHMQFRVLLQMACHMAAVVRSAVAVVWNVAVVSGKRPQ